MILNKRSLSVPFVNNPLKDRSYFVLSKHKRRRSRKSQRMWSMSRGGFWEYGVTNYLYGYGKWIQVKKHGRLKKAD